MATILLRMVAHPDTIAESPAIAAQRVTVRAPDGVALAGERRAPAVPRGEVLFAHGFGQTRQAWDSTALRLAAAGFAATAFDGRGHGDSGSNALDTPYQLDHFVADAHALAAAAPLRPAWVGASMGGLLGLLAQGEAEAAGAAGPFAALVLVDITPRWESAGVERILGFMRAHPHGFESMESAIEAIAGYLPHRRRKTPQQLASLLLPDGAGRLRWHWDPRLLDELAHESERWQARLAAAARRISAPTLLVSGGRSDLVSHETVGEFLGLVPHAAHVRIADATHMVAGDRNDVFTDAILDFLIAAGLPATARTNGPAP
jgi:pimeloyl-ACP methyl ester carboxylesterase